MSSPTLIARLGLDVADFTRGLNASTQGLASLNDKAKLTAAEIAFLQQRMATVNGGKGTQEQIQQYEALQKVLRTTQAEAKAMEKQLAAIEAIKPKTPEQPKTPPKNPREPKEDDGKHGGGNKAELAHSARSVLDMMAAGQSPLQALQMEAPRVAQAMGANIGSLIGIGIAGMLVGKLGEIMEQSGEVKRHLQDALRPDASQGIESVDMLKKRVAELTATIEESRPKMGLFARMGQGIADAFTSAGTDISLFARGKKGLSQDATHPEDQRADLRKKAEEARNKYIGQIVGDAKMENNFREDTFAKGGAAKPEIIERQREHAKAGIEEDLGIPAARAEIARVTDDPTIWDGAKQKTLKHLQEELNIRVKQAEGLQAEANRQFDLEEKKAQLEYDAEMQRRGAERDATLITHPGMTANPSNSSAGEVVDPKSKEFTVPKEMLAYHEVGAANAKYQDALGHLRNVRAAGGDDHAAADEAMRAEAALHDAAVARVMMTPAQRNEADRKQGAKDRAERALSHPGTRDADREGGTANDADANGSMIPDAGKGEGSAADSPDNARADFAPTHMPDRSFLPAGSNLSDEIRGGAENFGKGDGAFSDGNILTAINNLPTAIGAAIAAQLTNAEA